MEMSPTKMPPSGMGIVPPQYTMTTMITTLIHGRTATPSRLSNATGLFFSHSGRTYLVTSRHVLIDEEERYYPDSIEIRVHTDAQDISKNREVELPLYESGKPLWLEHPTRGSAVDLVVLSVEETLPKDARINYWTAKDFLPIDKRLPVGAHLSVIGYPLGFYDIENNLPMVRQAGLASIYQSDFRGNPFFLIDASLHEGTSGSPVITTTPRTIMDDKFSIIMGWGPPFLLGVNSGEFPDSKLTSFLGLHKVWYPYLITDIIDRTEKGWNQG